MHLESTVLRKFTTVTAKTYAKWDDGVKDLTDVCSHVDVPWLRELVNRLIWTYAVQVVVLGERQSINGVEVLASAMDALRSVPESHGGSRHVIKDKWDELIAIFLGLAVLGRRPFITLNDDQSCASDALNFARACVRGRNWSRTPWAFRHGHIVDERKVIGELAQNLIASMRPSSPPVIAMLAENYWRRWKPDWQIIGSEPPVSSDESYLWVNRRLLRQATHKYLYHLAWRSVSTSELPSAATLRIFPPALWFDVASTIVTLSTDQIPGLFSGVWMRSPIDYLQRCLRETTVFHEWQLASTPVKKFLQVLKQEGVVVLPPKVDRLWDSLWKVEGKGGLGGHSELIQKAQKQEPSLVWGPGQYNQKFLLPTDYVESTANSFPILKNGATVAMAPLSLFGRQAIEKAIATTGDHKKATAVFESFCRGLFHEAGMPLEHGNYMIGDIRGETDGIATWNDIVFLVEMKAGSFQKESLAGELRTTVLDLGKTLLEGAWQAYRAELFVRKSLESGATNIALHQGSHRDILKGDSSPTILSMPKQPRFMRLIIMGDSSTIFHRPSVTTNLLDMFYRYDFHSTGGDEERYKDMQRLARKFRDTVGQVSPSYPSGHVWFGTHYISFDMIWQLGQIGRLPEVLNNYSHIEANDRESSTLLDTLQSNARIRGSSLAAKPN